jgi:protocatechuate 3,4-dioxygenase beta subunit
MKGWMIGGIAWTILALGVLPVAAQDTDEDEARAERAAPILEAAIAACEEGTLTPTAPDGLGPYYLPGAPFKDDFVLEDMEGERLLVVGAVLNADCEPLPEATIDLWQADANGAYDFSEDFILRGRLLSDENGYYEFQTILPGFYGNRPRHIHILVAHPSLPEELVSQIYFAEDDRSRGAPNRIEITPDEEDETLWRGVFNIVMGE